MAKQLPKLTEAEAAGLESVIVAGTWRMRASERDSLVEKGCLMKTETGRSTVRQVTRLGFEALSADHPDVVEAFRKRLDQLPKLTSDEAAGLAGVIVTGLTGGLPLSERDSLIEKECLEWAGTGRRVEYRIPPLGFQALEVSHPGAIEAFREGRG